MATEFNNIPESPIENVLQDRAVSAPQRSIGALIEDVCPPNDFFPAGSVGTSKLNLALTDDLKQRCDEMWSNALFGRDLGGVQGGLQASADEENAVVGTVNVDLSDGQTSDVGNRLASLRSGVGSTVMLDVNGKSVALARGPQGGAAGDMRRGWGTFISGDVSFADRDASERESGFDGERYGVTAGLDYTFGEGVVTGISFAYARDDYDLSADGGSLESDSWTIMGYMGYSVGTTGHVDFMVGYTDSDYDQERTVRYSIQAVDPTMGFAAIPGVFTSVNQAALSETESDEIFVDVVIGNDWSFNTTVLGGYVGASYGDTTVDGFRERMSNPLAPGSGLALFIDEQDPESLIAKVGATLTFTVSMPFGNVYPFLMGEYLH